MCSECSDWQNKNTAKCRPSQAKGAFRVRLFRAFITVHFFLRVRGKIHLLLGCRWDRVAYAYAKLFFRAEKDAWAMGRGMPRPYYSCDPVTSLPFQHNRTISLHPSYFIGRNAML